VSSSTSTDSSYGLSRIPLLPLAVLVTAHCSVTIVRRSFFYSVCGEIDFTAFCDIQAYTKMQKPTFSPSSHTYIHTTHKLSLSCFLLMSGCYKSQTLYEMDLYDSSLCKNCCRISSKCNTPFQMKLSTQRLRSRG
jgi:hypothetical protein